MNNELPLFPLNLVLVPGAFLPLRIFEQRYLDMVRDAARDGTGFGVCLVTNPVKDSTSAQHARVGTAAVIRDFYTLDDGLLGITAQGAGRFRVNSTKVHDSGFLIGDVEWLDEPDEALLPVEFDLLAQITENFMGQIKDNYPDYSATRLQQSNWVGYRLTELLPIENDTKQLLLELNDPLERLQQIMDLLPQLQSGKEDE